MTDHPTDNVTEIGPDPAAGREPAPALGENLTNVVAKLVGFRRGDKLTIREVLDAAAVLAGAAVLAAAASAVLEWRRHR